MVSFAEIDENNKVVRVIDIPDDQAARGQAYISVDMQQGGIWKLTGQGSIYKNMAGPGCILDEDLGAFIHPKPPGVDCVFNMETCLWELKKKFLPSDL